jgi:excisionase family DNA binding protein
MELLKPTDVAEMLAVSRAWVYEAARTGRIPSVRIGGEDGPLRFVPEDIEQWLAAARAVWSPARGSEPSEERKHLPGKATPRTEPRRQKSSKRKPAGQQSLL